MLFIYSKWEAGFYFWPRELVLQFCFSATSSWAQVKGRKGRGSMWAHGFRLSACGSWLCSGPGEAELLISETWHRRMWDQIQLPSHNPQCALPPARQAQLLVNHLLKTLSHVTTIQWISPWFRPSVIFNWTKPSTHEPFLKKIVLPIYTRILTFHYLNVISESMLVYRHGGS